ncbi:MAG: sodium:proton antiporter NhaD, partial [Phocaeicola sp.]|nr:sodium:proton antiporter NhaD [Phocaeicola sp.]
MSTLTIVIVSVFILGYLCIALESVLKINKAAIALFMFVICWTFYMVNPMPYLIASGYTGGEEGMLAHIRHIIESHLGETAETLFFLMGAMTIVEIVDSNGGFNFVRNALRTTSKRKLMWRMAFLTFILSAILDNLTTSIVMIMLLHKLVTNHNDRLVYASMIIIAANSGGAFSPIGDVTTIMLWIGNMITTGGVIKEIFIPSLISMVVPVFILQYMLKGELVYPKEKVDEEGHELSQSQRQILFVIGVGGLIFVPVFRYLTDLPPFMGILLILSILWIVTEIFYSGVQVKQGTFANRVSKVLSRIDLPTIMFFLGILMAVGCLSEIGVLTALGQSLDKMSGGNHYLV